MRLRIDSIALLGTTRRVEFTPGLNLISGPITTGKTTLLRLCRALLGGGVESLPPEVRHNVSAVGGRLSLRDASFDVTRRLVTTEDAPVDIAGASEALRLPVQRSRVAAGRTYGIWLLDQLGIPQLQVPAAPTRPAESPSVPITINDFMLYCHLRQEDLDSDVFGHTDAFKNIKRKYVFEILFGIYDAEIAALQSRLREVDTVVRMASQNIGSFDSILQHTAWENRARLVEVLEAARRELAEVEAPLIELASANSMPSRTAALTSAVREIEGRLRRVADEEAGVIRSIEGLRRLSAQLEAQIARLTRAIAAGGLLVDFDFRICPRCGATVNADTEHADTCYLCHQVPTRQYSEATLLDEQDRIESQIAETAELLRNAERELGALQELRASLEAERSEQGAQLDFATRAYVSDQAETLTRLSERRGSLQEQVKKLEDYLRLFERLDALVRQRSEMETEKATILDQLDRLQARGTDVVQGFAVLEQSFLSLVERIGLPEFPGEPRAGVNRTTYLPVLNGRRFEELSSGGLKVLTNLTFALAHHVAAIRLGQSLPGILLIDSLTKNAGTNDYDWTRVEALFEVLRDLAREYADELQIIAVSNDVPPIAEDSVRIRLAPDDRLIPGV